MSERVPAAESDSLDALRVQLAPDLEVVRPIGKGTMARVYLAREPALKRLVAVKVLREDVAASEEARLRFEREAQAVAGISHPNVTALYRVGRLERGLPFIVMEYIQGRTLADLLSACGTVDLAEARRILGSVARGLASAHRKGVVHRDVRPANVMVEEGTDRIVLMDFGIAALVETGQDEGPRITVAGQRLGDPLHMSPEQLRGESATQQSDVYGLGVMAYELMMGAPPRRPPPALEELRPEVDPDFSRVVGRCLGEEPDQRPRAREVVEALLPRARGGAVPAGVAEGRASGQRGGAGSAIAPVGVSLLAPEVREFLAELQRRKVYRVAVAYAAGAFILLQATQLLIPGLPIGDPEAWYRGLVAVVLGGFPLALVLSWLFDLSAEGIRREDDREDSGARRPWSRLVLPLVGLALTIAGAFGVWILLGGR